MQDEYDFFFCYSRDSYNSIGKNIIRELEFYGLKLWVDKHDVVLGCNIFINIDNVLNRTKQWGGAIILFDSTFFNKEWCKKELNYFIENNITILPILYNFTKNSFPKEYTNLKKLDRVTVTSAGKHEFYYAINKILLAYISQYDNVVDKAIITSDVLCTLKSNYLNTGGAPDEKIIKADNIVLFLKVYYQKQKKIIPTFINTLMIIVHKKLLLYYSNGQVTKMDCKVVDKAINILLTIHSVH